MACAAAQVESLRLYQIVESFVSLATTFYASHQKSSRAHSAAPPFQIEPAPLGFDLVFLAGASFHGREYFYKNVDIPTIVEYNTIKAKMLIIFSICKILQRIISAAKQLGMKTVFLFTSYARVGFSNNIQLAVPFHKTVLSISHLECKVLLGKLVY